MSSESASIIDSAGGLPPRSTGTCDPPAKEPCTRCGQTPGHSWVDGDCVLQHRQHSTQLVDGAHVCVPCVKRWDDWLTEITELYAGLAGVVPAGSLPIETTGEYQKPRKKPASPAPFRLAAWAMLHGQINPIVKDRDGQFLESGYLGEHLPNVPDVLANWAEALYDHKQWGDGWPTTVTGAAAALRANRDTLATLPDVDTLDAELAWIRRHLRAAHGIADQQPVGRCPSLDGAGHECGGPLWPDRHGRMAVSCSRCGRRFDERFLSHLGGMLAS